MDSIKNSLSSKIQAAGRLNEITYKFKVLDTDEQRVTTMLRIMEMFETTPRAKCKTKDAQVSIDLRKRANEIFASSQNTTSELVKTWQLYSQSIAAAPNDSQELSLAYANRSAILMKLHKCEECVADVERALRLDYPDRLRGKLLCRKVDCLRILNERQSLSDALDEARNWLERAALSSSDKRAFERKLESAISATNWRSKLAKSQKRIPTFAPNKLIPCASEALRVRSDERYGRHVVAARDIEPGEILVVERPYSKLLSLDEVYTHCSHCLQAHWALIPCERCVHAMYCSSECKRAAWRSYHDVECRVTGHLLELDFGKDGLFSMRLAVVAVRDAGCVDSLRESLRGAHGFTDGKVYRSDSYVNLYSLVTSVEKRSVSDLFDRSLRAAVVVHYLCTLTNLFGKKFSADNARDLHANEDVTFVGGLILRHMQIIPCNVHSYEEERQMEIVDIGALALAFCSLINHSCDPNVSRCTTPNHMIVFALAPIKRGSQIFDNYGSHYAVMSKSERQSKLKQYYFDCCCEACERDWPVYNNLPSYRELVRDKEAREKIEKTLEKLDTYVHYAREDQIDDKFDMISELATMIATLIGILPLPCADVNNVVETLKRVFTLTYGNKFDVPKL